MSGIRIVVVSDRRLSCLALVGAIDLAPGIRVVSQVGQVAEAKDCCERGEADAVLLDASVLVRAQLNGQEPGPGHVAALTVLPSLASPAESLLAPDRLATLTPREREVFVLLGTGLSNVHIGKLLGVSQATVKSHVGRVLAKLDLESRLQAGLAAVALGSGAQADPGPTGREHQQRAAKQCEAGGDQPVNRVVRTRDQQALSGGVG